MLKFFGLISLFLSATLTGLCMNKSLKDRTAILKEIKSSAIHIKNEIEYRQAPLNECFRGRGRLFSNAYKLIEKNLFTPKHAVKKAVEDVYMLSQEDRQVINNFAENLSCEDLTGQIANFEMFIAALGENIQASARESAEKGKLFCYGGVMTGLGLIIILL